jgi:putative ABC transport system permease protein
MVRAGLWEPVNMSSLLRIAFRNVLRNRRRSVITFSAIFLALAVMVTIRGFLDGMQASIRESVVLGQTGALQIHRRGFLKALNGASLDRGVPVDGAFLARITSVPGVKAATPRIAFGGMINANDATTVAVFTAIDPRFEPQVCPQRLEMISSGRTLAESGPASGIFAPELAASLGLRLGEKATLLASDKDGVLNALELDFVGAYGQPGMPLPEKKVGFVPLAFAQELLRMEGTATELALAVERLDDVEKVKPLLQAAVGPEYEVSSWHDVAPWVDDAIAAQNFILNLLAFIFLFVALLGIANTMLMSVFERTREIGTMMSVGVRRRQILGLFLLEAALLGLAGGLLGAAAGTAFVLQLGRTGVAFRVGDVPLHIHPSVGMPYVALTLALATGGAVAAAIWPSLRASRLRPVEALASV